MELILDTARMRVGSDGHPHLPWPVGPREVVKAREAILRALASAARTDPATDDPRRALGVLYPRILQESLAAYYAQAVVRRSKESGRTVVLQGGPPGGRGDRLTRACLSGFTDEAAPVHRELSAGPARGRAWVPRAVRHARWTLALNGPTPRAALPIRWGQDTVTVSAEAFVRARARASRYTVRYVREDAWFRPLRNGGGPSGTDRTDLALKAIEQGFRAGGEAMGEAVRQHLHQFIERAVAQIDAHMERLRAVKTLPTTLWTGSGAQIWHRMLRHEVRRRGGRVVGHAHGTGGGYLDLDNSMFTDLDSCDVFATFTQPHAEAHRTFLHPELLLQPRPPQIEGHGPGLVRTHADAARPGRVRRAMYVSSYYKGEQAGYSGFIPDAIQVDFEARLFHHLREWGIEPIEKPHPSSVGAPPTDLGATVMVEPFESVMDRADVVITTQTQSTSFVSALQARRPLVLVDLGFYRWHPRARELLERGCCIVKADFDEDHRIVVPWTELREAIGEAPSRNDPAFYDAYLNYAG